MPVVKAADVNVKSEPVPNLEIPDCALRPVLYSSYIVEASALVTVTSTVEPDVTVVVKGLTSKDAEGSIHSTVVVFDEEDSQVPVSSTTERIPPAYK